MSKSFIECASLTKLYHNKNQTIAAVKDVSLQIDRGEFILLKGRSGAGKSTLLNLMTGLIKPTSGTVRIDDQIITDLGNKELSTLLLNKVGIIFQNFNLLPTYDVLENIEIALIPKGFPPWKMRDIAMTCLEQFQLSDKIHHLPEELSAGQQQKVAIVRSLVRQPSVIFADEPTASVDNEIAGEILDHLRNLRNDKSITVILATHGVVPDNIADRIVRIENGSICSQIIIPQK